MLASDGFHTARYLRVVLGGAVLLVVLLLGAQQEPLGSWLSSSSLPLLPVGWPVPRSAPASWKVPRLGLAEDAQLRWALARRQMPASQVTTTEIEINGQRLMQTVTVSEVALGRLTETCFSPLGADVTDIAADHLGIRPCLIELESNGLGQGGGTATLESGTLVQVVGATVVDGALPSSAGTAESSPLPITSDLVSVVSSAVAQVTPSAIASSPSLISSTLGTNLRATTSPESSLQLTAQVSSIAVLTDTSASISSTVSSASFFAPTLSSSSFSSIAFASSSTFTFSSSSFSSDQATSTASSPTSTSGPASSSSSAPPAAASAFTMPGTQLQVLPVGLGVFAGVSVLGLAVFGIVTYERRKYRRLFRARRDAEDVERSTKATGFVPGG